VSRRATNRLTRVLRKLGIERLRPGQREVIEAVLEGEDTLAVMPTGSGKSLCYQVPALALDAPTLVVSPLISLMKDQADKVSEQGVEAATLNSTLTSREEARAMEEIRREKARIVYVTPERLASGELARLLGRHKPALAVIDEAHCISHWGHDFRPAYLEIAPALAALGHPAVLALTATATADVIDDIRAHLQRPRMKVVNTGVYRPNLFYAVRQVTNPNEHRSALLELARRPGSGIVYCATVKAASEVHELLSQAGEEPQLYHGRLSPRERSERQDAFIGGAARLMVATNAFGMGIDKPDIRFIVHYQVPASIEAYYQESGRAGRDGEEATCTLLYDHADRRVQRFLTAGRIPTADELRALAAGERTDLPATVARAARALLRESPTTEESLARLAATYRERAEGDRLRLERMTAYAQSAKCRWRAILDYFGEPPEWERCEHCDNCARVAPAEPEAQPLGGESRDQPGLRPGDAVELPRYGEGRVRSATDERVQVEFPDGVTRHFLAQYVRPLR
jgi:ATP-dependent DNA helicase RecQ